MSGHGGSFIFQNPSSHLAEDQLQSWRLFNSSQDEREEKNPAVSSTLGVCDRCCLPHYRAMKLYCSLRSIDFYVSKARWRILK